MPAQLPLHAARGLLLTSSLAVIAATSSAQVPLADQPVFSSVSVPGNLVLALSVEFPTAVSVAHPSGTYSSAATYIGYFDPMKCYDYKYTAGGGLDNYFYPTGKTTTRTCSGKWSGNYLNWATMQTIDPFRWALTGGYRVVDTSSLTVLEKAWGNQGSESNFPIRKSAGTTLISGATPFSTASDVATRVLSLGNKMYFKTSTSGAPDVKQGTVTDYNPTAKYDHGTLYQVFVRVKVCDPSSSAGGLESNCQLYGTDSYKPTGLLQQYSDKIRYSAFGYLNDDDIKRDGGVLRARQKFIGPTMPVPGGLPISNPAAEWDAGTGIMATNPDSTDATSTGTALGITISHSGVMNYLNKFGSVSGGNYKTYDPVGELYYAAQRYLRNKGNVTAWSSMPGADQNRRRVLADAFPVITSWDDPVQYSCQRNFILGIGDTNTHADRNLPGATGGQEPTKPTAVSNDTDVNATTWTNRVGVLEGLGNALGDVQGYNGCCNNNGALMAGLAYWANVSDVRSDLTGVQNIKTYWLDVLEYGQFDPYNQFYLAAKYGGFNAPETFSADTATPALFSTNKSWWATTTDTTPNGAARPDNYYTASQADQMVAGLTKSFSSIASQLAAYSTSFSTASPQFSTLGLASYATKYDSKTWTGDLEASLATIDAATGKPELAKRWALSEKLAIQASGTGWDSGRNIVTFNTSTKAGLAFRAASLTTTQLSQLDPTYTTSSDASDYVSYVRGDRKNERSSAVAGSTKAYRDRAALVGDIVNAKSRPVGPPSAAYSATMNPGYDVFKTTYASRTPMVYAGSNAGMLHAVNGSLTGTDAGKEVFAYIPSAVIAGPTGTPSVNGLASVGNPDFLHRFLVDAPPIDVDVDFGRTVGGSGTDWRTLLLGGLGKGGKVIYALDITNPASITSEATAAAKVLWEFTDTDLGYVYGQPIAVKTRKHGWVIVVGSGYNNANGKGYFFFINPRTGALLEKVAAPCDACSSAKQAGMAHVNAFITDTRDGTADSIYGGDLLGNLWRLDVTGSSAYPAPVHFASLTGSDGKALPITTKPLPVIQPGTNRRYVTVGTGRLLDSSDLNNGQAQRFFAILDGTNASFSKAADLPTGASFPLTVTHMRQLTDLSSKIVLDLRSQIGWYVDLGVSTGGPGWRVLSDPASYYGVVTFAATAPNSGDACSPNGNSRLYAIDLGSGKCALKDGTSTCYVSPPEGVIVDVEVVADPLCTTSPCETGEKGEKNKKRVVYGTDRGKTGGNELSPPSVMGLQRLNWREIIVNN